MSTVHCGKRLLVSNVFKTLFLNTTTKRSSAMINRKSLSTTAIIDSDAPQKVIDYNRIIKSHAKSFKKSDKGQHEATRLLKEMKKKGIEPNSQTYLQLIIGISAQRHRNKVQNDRLENWFNQLFKLELKKERKKSSSDKMKKVLHHLSFYGHPKLKEMFTRMVGVYTLDNECWNMGMKGCIKSRNIQDAEDILNMARENNVIMVSSYKILIESYLLYYKDQKSASRIFSLMLNDKMTANYEIFELFINYYMEQPFSQDNSDTLHKLWQAVTIVTKEEMIPSNIIEKYISYYGNHGELSKAEQIYLDIKSRKDSKLNRRSFGGMNKIIVGFSNKRQLPSALSLYYDMIGEGYKPSKYVISKIIEACKVKNDTEAIQQLLDVTEELNPSAKLAQPSIKIK